MNIIAEIERGIKTGSFCSVQERGEKTSDGGWAKA